MVTKQYINIFRILYYFIDRLLNIDIKENIDINNLPITTIKYNTNYIILINTQLLKNKKIFKFPQSSSIHFYRLIQVHLYLKLSRLAQLSM